MKKTIITFILVLLSAMAFAQKMSVEQRNEYLRIAGTSLDSHSIHHAKIASMPKKAMMKEESEEEEFIFNPDGTEKLYCMNLYSFDWKYSQFKPGKSLLSQIRYSDDNKTVYFKHLTKSLDVITWLKGEIDGDTIRVPFGQPLAYYKGQYLVFFVPMIYNDNTGEMEAQDEFKLVIKDDSLSCPQLGEGLFQAALGYVFISDDEQGFLTMDVDHAMRYIPQQPITVPEDVEPVDYVYSFTNSYGNEYKKKSLVKKKDNDLYMQLSTSAPDAYIHGKIDGDSISVENCQVITDSTFVYFYSLATPVYFDGKIDDFVMSDNTMMRWWPESNAITSSKEVLGVDYMDGMELCMDFVMNPTLSVYGGDIASTPINPEWRSAYIDGGYMESLNFTYNYIVFTTPALDVDSVLINKEKMAYRIYINDNLYTFNPSLYNNLSSALTDMPCTFADNYDFYTYDQLHYVYLHMHGDDIKKIGIQTVYTVDGIERCSEIVTKNFEQEVDPDDPRKDHDLSLESCRVKRSMLKSGEVLEVVGKVRNAGKEMLAGYNVTLTTDGKEYTVISNDSIKANAEAAIRFAIPVGEKTVQNSIPVQLKVGTVGNDIDESDENDVCDLSYSIYEETLTRNKVLLEEFTSEYCGWCPYGAFRIETAIEDGHLQDDVIWVCHHDGFSTDWLTHPVSTELLELYGPSTFAPAWTLNRNVNYSDEDYPVFGIPFEEEIMAPLEDALAEPCFVDVKVESNYVDGHATITVKAEKNASFDGQCPTPYVSLFVIEDSITPHKQKSYGSYIIEKHNNVLRDVLTSTWGQAFEWNGNEAEIEFGYEVPESYKLKDLKVVAFIHENNADINCRKVFNASQTYLADVPRYPDDIKAVNNEDANDSRIYNLAGQRIPMLMKGVNILNGKKVVK